jgi:hypothetical protein
MSTIEGSDEHFQRTPVLRYSEGPGRTAETRPVGVPQNRRAGTKPWFWQNLVMMKILHRSISPLWVILAFTSTALADVDAVQPADDGISDIACSTAITSVRAGSGNLAVDPGDYHYRIYLPTDYSKRIDETFPCLLILSPSGNARLGGVADFAKRERWIVILLVESRNGPTAPQMGNFLAAYDDAIKRFRIQPGMIFATGQSGGARSSLLCAELRPGFGGVLLQAAGSWLPPGIRPDHTFRAMNP